MSEIDPRRTGIAGDGALIEQAGRALYGENWHTGLARDLEVSGGAIRNWHYERNKVPPGVWRNIAELVAERRDELAGMAQQVSARMKNDDE
jgi:hypothetical protein